MTVSTAPLPPMPDFRALRDAAIRAFLAQAGFAETSTLKRLSAPDVPLAYFLVTDGTAQAVLLDTTPAHATRMVAQQIWLDQQDVQTILPLVDDMANGFVLFPHIPHDAPLSVDLLPHALANLSRIAGAGAPPFALPTMAHVLAVEQNYFTDWYWPARHGYETPPDKVEHYTLVWRKIWHELPDMPPVFCCHIHDHRHILLPPKNPIMASPLYDVASLVGGFDVDTVWDLVTQGLADDNTATAHFFVHAAHYHMMQMGQQIRHAIATRHTATLPTLMQHGAWLQRLFESHSILQPLQRWFALHCDDVLSPLPPLRFFVE